MKKFFGLPAVFTFALILAACSTPPTEEMNRAYDAVIRAENDANAVLYAPNILIRARDALVRMEAEVDAKRYDAAKNFAAEAVSNAERAIAEGRAGAERAREEAANLINSLSGPLEETSNAVGTAGGMEGLELDFDTLLDDLDLTHQTYNEARQNLDADNFPDAIAEGQAVRSLLSDINAQLTEAALAASRKQ